MFSTSREIKNCLEQVFGIEDPHEILRQCCTAFKSVTGFELYAVDDGGAVVCSAGQGPGVCKAVRSTVAGLQACEEHFGSCCSNPGGQNGMEARTCHAGLVTLHLSLAGHGHLIVCGARTPDEAGAVDVAALAGNYGLDAKALSDAYSRMHEYSNGQLQEWHSTWELAVTQAFEAARTSQALSAERELNHTRIVHVGKELDSLKTEYEDVTREAFTQNDYGFTNLEGSKAFNQGRSK